MPLVTLTLPTPHSGQRRAWRAARRFNVGACGRRWGKTTFFQEMALRPALEGRPVGWFAPTYKLLTEAWRQIVATARPVLRGANYTDKRMDLITGGVIEFWTLEDSDAGRSRKYARAIIDEAGLVKGLLDIWHQAIRPTLADLTGDAWFGGTPKGRNDFWDLWQLGGHTDGWMAWRAPTQDNPHISPAEVAEMRASMPALVSAQELDAEFTDGALNLFRAEDIDRAGRPYDTPVGDDFITTVDVGRRRDATVINTFEVSAAPYRRVFFERLERVSFPYIQRRLADVQQQYPGPLIVESNGIGDPVIENTEAQIEPFTTTAKTKLNALQALQILFERGDILARWDARERAALLNCSWSDDHTADEVMSLAIFAAQVVAAGGGWGLA